MPSVTADASRPIASGAPLATSRENKNKEARARFWITLYLALQIGSQLGLLIEGIGTARVIFRVATFAISLVFLLFIPGRNPRQLFGSFFIAIVGLLTLEIFHPGGGTMLARVAAVALNVAIISPLIWVGRMYITPATFRRLVIIMWGYYTLSATFGVLQTYYPGRFQPNISSAVLALGESAEGRKTVINGVQTWRPMGLTDSPGAACNAGVSAFLFGLGFYLNSKTLRFRGAAVASIAIGLFCVYCSQVRSALVVAAVSAAVLPAVMMWRGNMKRSFNLMILINVAFIGAYVWAVNISGESTEKRISSLFEKNPFETYQTNRGHFLQDTLQRLLLEYPLGAGLGRWGVVGGTFGSGEQGTGLYAEIQATGWLLDGGAPLMVTYYLLLFAVCRMAWRLAKSKFPGEIPDWAALVLAYDLGVAAVTFNYPVFVSQTGMEFWLLNAALFSAAVSVDPTKACARPIDD